MLEYSEMKPISQATTEAVVQFNSSNGKFYLRTKQRWGIFHWWKTVKGNRHTNYWMEVSYTCSYFDSKADAEDYAKRVGLTLV